MKATSRVAAAATLASIVPFQCIICFDDYSDDVHGKYPVVLPCGHTYVCNSCARRLKRCMECREALFYYVAPPTPPTISHYRHSPNSTPHRDRYATASSPAGAAPAEKIALPLPKNQVLMDMIRASERPSKRGADNQQQLPEVSSVSSDTTTTSEEEELDMNRVISGMVTFTGPCGTYAVREPKGLVVLTSPQKALGSKNGSANDDGAGDGGEDEATERDDDFCDEPALQLLPSKSSLVDEENDSCQEVELLGPEHDEEENDYHALHLSDANRSLVLSRTESNQEEETLSLTKPNAEISNEAASSSENLLSTTTTTSEKQRILSMGQKVQVVRFVNGIATLARGKGYVVATKEQLVKVGGPLDAACRWEGMMDTLELRGQHLQKDLDRNLEMECNIKSRLDFSEPPTYPIITDRPQVLDPLTCASNSLVDCHNQFDGTNHRVVLPYARLQHQQSQTTIADDETQGEQSTSDVVIYSGHYRQQGGNDMDDDDILFGNRATVHHAHHRRNNNQQQQHPPLDAATATTSPAYPGVLSAANSIDNSEIRAQSPPAPATHDRHQPQQQYNVANHRSYAASSDSQSINSLAFGCGSALFGRNFLLSFDDHPTNDMVVDRGTVALASASFEDEEQNKATTTNQPRRRTAQIPIRPRPAIMSPNSPVVQSSSSFDTMVNWRTGMSGHRGLSKTSAQTIQNVHRTPVRLMSAHRGIGSMRGPVTHSPGNRGNHTASHQRSHSTSPAFGPRYES